MAALLDKVEIDLTRNMDGGGDTAQEENKESVIILKHETAESNTRETWSGRFDFVMSALSFAVGMGNIWRFPYLAYRNGGGAFLIPYVTMVILVGFPMMFLEFSFGQYGRAGVVSIWKISPLFEGVGWTMFAVSGISCIYYNMLNAYSFFYMFSSLAKDLPWRTCGHWWNTPLCGGLTLKNDTYNNTLGNSSDCAESGDILGKSAADEFFHKYVLRLSVDFSSLGSPRWPLALCLLLAWTIVFVCLWKGIKSQGKVTHVTTLFPYLILAVLFIRGLTLDGSSEGIMYYLTPQWGKLFSAKVWGDAAVQVFFSMSICWGGLITLASYNKFTNNCLRDSIIVATGDCLTSIFSGFVIFAILGSMAKSMGVPIEQVATQGAGLAFIAYPAAVTRLPAAQLLSVLFMLMLINLGIGTQFTLVTTVHTTLMDVFPKQLKVGVRPSCLLLAICGSGFAIGLLLTTQAGMYILQLMDTYAPSYGLLVIGLVETIVISYVYGINRFMKNIQEMLGSMPSLFWKGCWFIVTPCCIVAILVFTFVDFKRSSYGDYQYPIHADIIGWLIVVFEVSFIPIVAIYKLSTFRKDLPFFQRLTQLSQPTEEWCSYKDASPRGAEVSSTRV